VYKDLKSSQKQAIEIRNKNNIREKESHISWSS